MSITWCLLSALIGRIVSSEDRPHIVLIVADDLGWYDVGFHGGNQIPTPNIDALAYNGIILNSHYVQATGTPSRAALFTGKYPMRSGMQGPSFHPGDKRALPEGKIMPEYFKDLGYETHLVGKWNLGYSKWNETPTFRGFQHHFGCYNSYTSYYDYLTTWRYDDKDYTGFDLRADGVAQPDSSGIYATDAFAERSAKIVDAHDLATPLFLMIAHLAPHTGNRGKFLEAPQETVNKFAHVEDANRRTYAAMVSKLDDAVGSIVDALSTKGMLQNSIVVFMSDNGAPTVGPGQQNWGSNYPLRGVKDTLFEGGIRSAAFVYSPLLVQSGRVSTDLIHVTDWLPTLYAAANGDVGLLDPDLDGIDQWSSLAYDLPSPRNDILLNIDEKTRNAALRFYNWKLIVGTSNNGTFNDYYGHIVTGNAIEPSYDPSMVYGSMAGKALMKTSYTPLTESEYEAMRTQSTIKCLDEKAKKNPCDPATGNLCLYDIPSDPCEENDLAKFFPSVVRRMKRALVDYRKGLSAQIEEEVDMSRADPKSFGFKWNPWDGCADVNCEVVPVAG